MTGELITADGIRRGLVARVEARVLPKAGARSLRQHRDAIARAVAGVAPRTAEQRHQDASERRRVEFRSEADGMAWLSVYGPAVDLMAVKVMLDAAAEAAKTINPDDPRTYDQIRVDTLTELAWAILETGHLPDFADNGDRCAESADNDGPTPTASTPPAIPALTAATTTPTTATGQQGDSRPRRRQPSPAARIEPGAAAAASTPERAGRRGPRHRPVVHPDRRGRTAR